MLDFLYEDIGGKIKNWAKWIFIVEAVGAIITGFVLMVIGDEDLIPTGLLTMCLGPIVAWVGSWILYAFGQLVEDVHILRNIEVITAENKGNQETTLNIKRETKEEKTKREYDDRGRRQNKSSTQTNEFSTDDYINVTLPQYETIQSLLKEDNSTQLDEYSDTDYIDITCPTCGLTLSFLKSENDAICPECESKFKIK